MRVLKDTGPKQKKQSTYKIIFRLLKNWLRNN